MVLFLHPRKHRKNNCSINQPNHQRKLISLSKQTSIQLPPSPPTSSFCSWRMSAGPVVSLSGGSPNLARCPSTTATSEASTEAIPPSTSDMAQRPCALRSTEFNHSNEIIYFAVHSRDMADRREVTLKQRKKESRSLRHTDKRCVKNRDKPT